METAEMVGGGRLGYDSPEYGGYEASRWAALPIVLPRGDVCDGDVFVDLGSGKGRVVLEAARRYPFKRAIGVELSDELNQVARANLARARARLRCRNVEFVPADASEWALPPDVTIVYLYNPFKGELFSRVVDGLARAIDSRGTPLRIIYVHPVEHARLMQTDGVTERPPPPPWSLALAGLSSQGARRYELHPRVGRAPMVDRSSPAAS